MDYRVIYLGAQVVFGILFLVFFFLHRVSNRGRGFNILDALHILFFITVVLDGIWIFIDGVPAYRTGHIVLETVYLSIMATVGYLWFLYTLELFPAKMEKIRKLRFIIGIPVLIEIILVVSSVKTGWFFSVDANGVYTRTPLHLYGPVLNYCYMMLGSFVALQCRKNALLMADKRRFTVAALFPLPILILSGIQLLLPPGIPMMQGGVLIAFLLLYGSSQNERVMRDHLTGLPNRIAFEGDLMERIHKRHGNKKTKLYLMEGDLDDFKKINDSFGHLVGDQALLVTADALREVFGPSGNVIFRTGGDEFMIILESETAPDVDAIRRAVNEELAARSPKEQFTLSMSLGMEEYDGEMDFRMFIDGADQKLYAAKKAAG